jgi:hypothetical protein
MTDRHWTDRLLEIAAALTITALVFAATLVWTLTHVEGKIITTPAQCAEIVAVSPIFNSEAIRADEERTAKGKRK